MNREIIAVIGLGYVELPLAVAFGKEFKTLGYDLSGRKVASYRECHDPAGDVSGEDFRAARHLSFTTDPSSLSGADYLIIAVPTPVDAAHQPDFRPLISFQTNSHSRRSPTISLQIERLLSEAWQLKCLNRLFPRDERR